MSVPSLARFKRCSKCSCTKLATVDFFSRSRTKQYGLQAWCKVCSRLNGKRWLRENPERHYENTRSYYEANKERLDAYRKGWREENREHLSKLAHIRYERNREQILANNKAWKEANAEYYREYCREYGRRWLKANREKAQIRVRAYFSRKRGAAGTYTFEDIWEMYEAQDGLCAWCEMPTFGKYHVDHFVPIVKGGDNSVSNLCVTCPTCNMRKHAKTPLQFLKVLGYDVIEEAA